VRIALAFLIILIAYALLLLATILFLPLRLGEILQAAAFLNFSWDRFFAWIAQTPGGAPLHYLAQVPFALASPYSRLFLRIPSAIFALGSAISFFVLAKRVPLQHPLLALILFLMIPVHLAYATQGRPYELGLFLSLLAALSFFALVQKSSFVKALIYALLLTACLYTQPSCYLPGVGYLVYLLGFANLPSYRRALWYALPATILPLAAYAPYYAWAGVQRAEGLAEQFPAYALKVAGIEALMSLDPETWSPWFGIGLMGVLLVGLVGGIWSTLPLGSYPEGAPAPSAGLMRKRAVLFCLAGGAIVTILGETALSGWTNAVFAPYQILWALPSLIILLCAALDALLRLKMLKSLALVGPAVCILAILLCIPGDVEYVRTPPPDMASLTALVLPQLQGDACVVFVSEGYSRYLFEVFEPDLAEHECKNFFHKRVVLAIHPFVRPDQERDARVYFHGLEFAETHRGIAGDGKIITMDAQR
jgi:hypothetical protein